MRAPAHGGPPRAQPVGAAADRADVRPGGVLNVNLFVGALAVRAPMSVRLVQFNTRSIAFTHTIDQTTEGALW